MGLWGGFEMSSSYPTFGVPQGVSGLARGARLPEGKTPQRLPCWSPSLAYQSETIGWWEISIYLAVLRYIYTPELGPRIR